jgi:uncharacterized protein
MTATPAIDGWFTTDGEPRLLGSRCDACSTVFFPPTGPADFCRNPGCGGETFTEAPLSRRGRVWSYTDAQYQPPPPYVARTDPYQPFALAAVELAEGLTVLGQVADGYGVKDLAVGAEVELVVEPLDGDLLIWRWKPVTELGEEADQ